MAEESVTEVVEEKELDVIHTGAINDERITSLHDLAMALPQLEKDMDAIQRFVVRRSLPGDWIGFKDRGGDDKVELGFAGALRIARDLGISWIEWTHWKEVGTDDRGPWYTHWFQCTTTYRGRRIEMVQGRAGTRDDFFGTEHKTLKNASDINEGDVKTAARHSCMAEGVKVALGLHRMPKKALIAMGLDVGKIKEVSFESKGKVLGDGDKQANKESGLIERSITVKELKKAEGISKANGKPWIRWDVTDTESVKYAMFVGKVASKRAALLEDSYGDALPVKIEFQVNKSADRESYLIIKVNGVVDDQ